MKKASDLHIPYTWEERKPIVLDRFFYIPGHFEKDGEWSRIPWSDGSIFGNPNPVSLEYCSGNGEWICAQAKLFPQMNFVAIEKRFDRARKIWLRLHRENLPNVFVVCGEAFRFSKFYAPLKSVSKMYVNFPDPWPKLRHAKHRIIRDAFLLVVETLALPGCTITLVSDDAPSISRMIEVFEKHPAWHPVSHKPLDVADYGPSYFCTLWKEKGKHIQFLQYEVVS